jgi:hypothetical protein
MASLSNYIIILYIIWWPIDKIICKIQIGMVAFFEFLFVISGKIN